MYQAMKLKPPEHIPVEKSFNEFVKDFGGELVSELMPRGHELPRNADYLFLKELVVAELKCLEKDLFNNEEEVERITRLIQKWTSSGIINGSTAIEWLFGQALLPDECYRDMIRLAARTIETAIRSAKKQIERTKEYFDLPQTNGLVLLANDGNYFLEHQEFFELTCQIMGSKFMDSSIDGFVYFSANMPVAMPGHEREMLLWVPSYRDENNKSLGKFVNELGEKWFLFYQKKIRQEGVPIKQIENFDEGIEALKSMRHIKKYRRKKR